MYWSARVLSEIIFSTESLQESEKSTVPKLQCEYKETKSKIAKITHNTEELKYYKNLLKQQNQKLLSVSTGLEHCFRELGQIFEAVKEVDTTSFVNLPEMKNKVDILPQISAEILIEGFALEIMDGEASHVPITWVKAIIKHLDVLLKDKKIFVLSILGVQSSGKSTLLNTMFGLRFKVGVGRCTRGAFIQLLRVDKKLESQINCSYILVVDTEGIRAPELLYEGSEEHDNELATFVIGIADYTIINVYGEEQVDLTDVLQTAVHAFIRMKQVYKNTGCIFVHQNVNARFNEALKAGKRSLINKLDTLTQDVAKLENCEGQFKDVICFDEENLHYFSSLWKGDPPMAPVNSGYSESVQELKQKIVSIVEQHNTSSTFKSFGKRLNTMWKAVLKEDYIFNFKNAIEISVYSELDADYGKKTQELQELSETLLFNCDCKLNSSNTEKPETIKNTCMNDATKQLNTKCDELCLAVNKFIEEHEFSEILSKWEWSTKCKLMEIRDECVDSIRSHCRRIILMKQ